MFELANEQGRRICLILEDVLAQISEEGSLIAGIVLENEDCRGHRQELDRLHSALQTYLETDPSLRYVGLVGSFSSGKTATINNLLELAGTDQARPEDINPVDERLTLCAHFSVKESLLSTLLKSAWDADNFFHE